MKVKGTIIPFSLWADARPTTQQLHGIEKAWFLARESVYWTNMNTDIEGMIKQYATCLEYQQLQEKSLHYAIPIRPWEVAGLDAFMINNKTLLCIVDYHSKFPIVKTLKSLSTDDLL